MYTLIHLLTGLDAYFELGRFNRSRPSLVAYRRIYGFGEQDTAVVVFNKNTQKLEGVPPKQPNKLEGLINHLVVGSCKDLAIVLMMLGAMNICKSCMNANAEPEKEKVVSVVKNHCMSKTR